MQFSWKVASGAWGGKWQLAVQCAATKARLQSLGMSAGAHGVTRVAHARPGATGPIARRITPKLLGASSPVALSSGIGGGGACEPYGTLLVPGTAWLGGQGVNVYSNGAVGGSCWSIYLNNGAFAKYQCVELINRLVTTKGWSGVISGNASAIFGNASDTNFDKHTNGTGYVPVPGDIVVWGGGYRGYGHIAAVTAVANGWVDTVEQNNTASGTSAYPIDGAGNIGTPGRTFSTTGVLHAKRNGSTAVVPAPTPTPPSQSQGPAAKALTTVNLRSGPGTSFNITRTVATGTVLNLSCYTSGTTVSGPYGTESAWDQTTTGDWVSDALVYTGSNSPVVPTCSGGGAPPPSSGPTGKVIASPCLNFHSAAGTSAPTVACIPQDTIITIQCTTTSTAVTGPYGTETIWDRTAYNGQTGFVSDAWVYTGVNGAVAGAC